MYDLPTGNPGEEFDWAAFEAKFPSDYPGQAEEEYRQCLEEYEAIPTHRQHLLEKQLLELTRTTTEQAAKEATKQLTLQREKTARLRAQLRALGVEPEC